MRSVWAEAGIAEKDLRDGVSRERRRSSIERRIEDDVTAVCRDTGLTSRLTFEYPLVRGWSCVRRRDAGFQCGRSRTGIADVDPAGIDRASCG